MNDDHPSESEPGKGDYAVAGNSVKVAPLSDEDCRTPECWIDLDCPIDLD